MIDFNRRDFLKSGGVFALSGVVGGAGFALTPAQASQGSGPELSNNAVHFKGDGLSLTPVEYTHLLGQLAASEGFESDYYASGGIIEKLEQKFAELLDKETAVFLPTGTMANHIALRRLAGSRKRVIVQADSHIYNDSGDCAQKLSGLNLLPIEGDYSAEAIDKVLRHSKTGRVKSEVGAICLESPVRRDFNTTHSLDQVAEISELARKNNLGLHLDGARMFMQAAHQGFSPAEMAVSFDSVYVSLYKNFNAAGGAVLVGSKENLADLLHERRMFGGSPPNVWPMAAVALLFADDFIKNYRQAKTTADQLMDDLNGDPRFNFELIPEGSNSLWLHLKGVEPKSFVRNLGERNIHLREPLPDRDGLLIVINPTVSRMTAAQLAGEFRAAAKA